MPKADKVQGMPDIDTHIICVSDGLMDKKQLPQNGFRTVDAKKRLKITCTNPSRCTMIVDSVGGRRINVLGMEWNKNMQSVAETSRIQFEIYVCGSHDDETMTCY